MKKSDSDCVRSHACRFNVDSKIKNNNNNGEKSECMLGGHTVMKSYDHLIRNPINFNFLTILLVERAQL